MGEHSVIMRYSDVFLFDIIMIVIRSRVACGAVSFVI